MRMHAINAMIPQLQAAPPAIRDDLAGAVEQYVTFQITFEQFSVAVERIVGDYQVSLTIASD